MPCSVERELGVEAEVSAVVESEPWGFDSPNMFLNIGVNVEVGDLAPLELLYRLQAAQRSVDDSSHRKADGSYADRRVDIDLIALGEAVVDTASAHGSARFRAPANDGAAAGVASPYQRPDGRGDAWESGIEYIECRV